MKFRCDRDALSEALQTVQRGVSSRPGIPALTGVLIEAAEGGALTLITTDLEVSARLSIDVQVTEPGIALVPARLLGDTVKSLSNAPVDVETDQGQARIRCAAYEGTLRLLPAEDFPGLQEPSGTKVTAESAAFAEAVGQVARGASRDEARPVLTGVLLEVSREGVVMVATDSYRLAVRDLVATADSEAKAIVPERAMSEAGRAAAADEKGSIELFVDESQVSFRIGTLTLTSRLIEGEFPNYRQLLPETSESRLTVSRQQLLDAVRRVGLLARDTHAGPAGVQCARREALELVARPGSGGRGRRSAVRRRGHDGRVQSPVPGGRSDGSDRRERSARRARRLEAWRRARRGR